MRAAGIGLALALVAPLGAAGDVELTLLAGSAFPFYEQTFRYDPGVFAIPGVGASVRQSGSFELRASGGLAGGATLGWTIGRVVGLEARIDTAGVAAETRGARFDVSVELPPPLPALSSTLDVGSGRVDIDRVTPLSLNLKLRTPGARAALSAGLSYLPRVAFSAVQTIGLGVTGVAGTQLQVSKLDLRTDSLTLGGGDGLGANLGAAFRAPLGRRLGLELEGRFFLFGVRELTWMPADDRPLGALERALLAEALKRLPAVRFRPTFFQLSAGLTLRL